ncbi:MAG: FUSC family protein [Nocardioides sp.]|uniref:FUSC family protein n=1 Tax=Nocardioides sp. TaxID=35761 RepID=UPI003F03DC96
MRPSGESSTPTLTSQFFSLGPHAGSHRVALRAVVTVAVPLLLLWSLGRMEWSIYAAFSAFTSLYGRNDVHLSRLQMQALVGAALVASVVGGVAVGLSEHRGWLAVPCAALVAGVGSWLSDAQGWHPPGPLFLVFAFSACASVPSEPGDLPVALSVSAATAVLALVIGGAGAWWRVARRPDDAVRTRPRRSDHASVVRRHVVRCSAGCLVAGALATGLGIGHPYWAMVSAVVPLVAVDFSHQLLRGVQRVAGTLAGLVLAWALLSAEMPTLALICVVVALQAAAELWIGRNYALALVAVTPLALLMIHLMAPVPPGVLVVDRAVETVIGVAVGVALGWLTRPRSRPGTTPS